MNKRLQILGAVVLIVLALCAYGIWKHKNDIPPVNPKPKVSASTEEPTI